MVYCCFVSLPESVVYEVLSGIHPDICTLIAYCAAYWVFSMIF